MRHSIFALIALLLVLSSCGGNSAKNQSLPPAGEDGIMKILCIGNSFTEDAVGQYLWELFDDAGMEAVIAYLYIGGSTLEDHYNHMVNNEPAYNYKKIVDGVKTNTPETTILSGILDEDWDYITFQQSSSKSGLYDTYAPYLPQLAQYARENALNEDVRLVLFQTWAYPSTTNDRSFTRDYGGEQMIMYDSIVSAVNKAAEDVDIKIIIPCGTAIQNGRNSWLGDTFNRDERHLGLTYGRYTAACTWFETLSEMDVTTTGYAPEGVGNDIKEVVTHAAHLAVLNPNTVEPMTEWKENPTD